MGRAVIPHSAALIASRRREGSITRQVLAAQKADASVSGTMACGVIPWDCEQDKNRLLVSATPTR